MGPLRTSSTSRVGSCDNSRERFQPSLNVHVHVQPQNDIVQLWYVHMYMYMYIQELSASSRCH